MTTTQEEIYVLKDQDGKYVGDNSISYDKPTNEYFYSFSETLTNGFYTYSDEAQAKEGLRKLKESASKIKFKINFSFEKIDLMKILLIESKIKISKHPFVTKRINVDNKELAIA